MWKSIRYKNGTERIKCRFAFSLIATFSKALQAMKKTSSPDMLLSNFHIEVRFSP